MDGTPPPRAHAFFHSLISHRVQLYSLISLLAVSAVVLNALRNHSNFYSVAIYLSKSSRSVLVRLSFRYLETVYLILERKVLANFAVLLALFSGHVVQRIFFGSLRPNELEVCHLSIGFLSTLFQCLPASVRSIVVLHN